MLHEGTHATFLLRFPNVALCVGCGAALSEAEESSLDAVDAESRFSWMQKGKEIGRGSCIGTITSHKLWINC